MREYVEQLYGILWSVQRVDSAGGIWTFGGGGSSVDHLYVCECVRVHERVHMCMYVLRSG